MVSEGEQFLGNITSLEGPEEEALSHDHVLDARVESIVIILFIMISTIGMVVNLCVAATILLAQGLQNREYGMVLNLCVVDLLMCMVGLPFTLVQTLRRNWIFGSFMCHVVPFFQASIIFALSLTTTLITFERVSRITGRFSGKKKPKVNLCRSKVLLIWFIAFLMASPLAYYTEEGYFRFEQSVQYKRCVETWSDEVRLTYSVASFCISLVIPSICLFVSHLKIVSFLCRKAGTDSSIRKVQHKGKTELMVVRKGSTYKSGRNHRAILSLRRIILAYILSWSPLNLLNLYLDITYGEGLSSRLIYPLLAMAHSISATSAISNAILYGLLNTNIKRELLNFKYKFIKKVSSGPLSSTQSM